MSVDYICTGFENASPANWAVNEDGTISVDLIYDRERCSPNRAVLHWHIQVQASPGSDVTVVLRNFDNIWNGRPGSPIRDETSCCVSEDGREWRVVQGCRQEGNVLAVPLKVRTGRLFLARIEPYRISDLDRFLGRLPVDSRIAVTAVGATVEGRPLELLRVGDPASERSVLLRVRAHPWETGGNWLLEGLVDRLLRIAEMDRTPGYCLYAMPMANKDGVARGGHRFNLMGMDLNRNWDRPADPELAPENAALERWLTTLMEAGQRPDLAVDLHNDGGGQLHVSRPERNAEPYLADMARFEQALRDHTWFTEGSTGANFRNPGSFGEGLYERFDIAACILELNCNWSAGLSKAPLGHDWRLLGEQMHDAFEAYFAR